MKRQLWSLALMAALLLSMSGCIGIGIPGVNLIITVGPADPTGTWSLHTTTSVLSPPGHVFTEVHMASTSAGWAVSKGGSVFRFDGATWNYEGEMGVRLDSVWATSSTTCWTAGYSDGFWYYDGVGWTSHPAPTRARIFALQFTAPDDGWAVSQPGTIYHYDGANWSENHTHAAGDLIGLHMLSSTRGWAVGNLGYAVTYDGTQWTEQDIDPASSTPFETIWGVSESEVWAGDHLGRIYFFDGTNWSLQATTVSGDKIRAIRMTSSMDGWAVDGGGHFYHFDGASWALHTTTAAGVNVNSVSMVSPSDGWAVGEQGNIYRYSVP